MSCNKAGNQTLVFQNKPMVEGAAAVVGVKEGQGPMSRWFDRILEEDTFGEKTWEMAESKMLKTAMLTALQRSGRDKSQIDAMISGDLINQLMSSSFMARDLHIPFLGIYGACSTMAESAILGSLFIDGGYGDNVLIGASSHYCTAERQFRMPLEHGNQRPPSAQWTATAAGSLMLASEGKKSSESIAPGTKVPGRRRLIRVTYGTIGKIIDTGMKDANQMGAAMAPAAVDTILSHFEDTGRSIDDYDMILTGDLGFIGKEIAMEFLIDAGVDEKKLCDKYDDCGAMLYDKNQDVHGGGSGCGCSASIFAGYVKKILEQGKIKNAFILSTGALLSTVSPFQGQSIPAIAHGIVLEGE